MIRKRATTAGYRTIKAGSLLKICEKQQKLGISKHRCNMGTSRWSNGNDMSSWTGQFGWD